MRNLFFVLGTIVFLSSCKKSNIENPADLTAAKKLVKSIYVWDNQAPDIEEYSYDVKGRLAAVKDNDRTATFNYVSPTSLIVTRKNNSDNSLDRTYECTLNNKGAITLMVMKDATGALYYTYQYTYDEEGYMTRMVGTLPTRSDYEVDYTIVNGNVVSSTNYNGGVLNYTGEYTYDYTKVNKTTMGHGSYWSSHSLFGKRSKNLVSEYKSKNPAGAVTWHNQFSYEMDAAGYPTKLTTYNVLSGKQGVDTFIYQ